MIDAGAVSVVVGARPPMIEHIVVCDPDAERRAFLRRHRAGDSGHVVDALLTLAGERDLSNEQRERALVALRAGSAERLQRTLAPLVAEGHGEFAVAATASWIARRMHLRSGTEA